MTQRVFISYARQNATALAQFKGALAPTILETVRIYSDEELAFGDRFLERLEEECRAADVIVFLVSKAFLESSFCSTVELIWGLDQANRHRSALVPVILEKCDWRQTRLKSFYAAPENGRPIADFPSPQAGYEAAAACILSALDPAKRLLWTGPSPEMTQGWSEAQTRETLSSVVDEIGGVGAGLGFDADAVLSGLAQGDGAPLEHYTDHDPTAHADSADSGFDDDDYFEHGG